MTKDQVKVICEADPELQWWAMVLFAEISDLTHHCYQNQFDAAYVSILYTKVKEFEGLIIQSKLNQSKNNPTLEKRVADIEKKLGIVQVK